MAISDLKAALDATGYRFAHYAWSKAPTGDYGVFGEEGASDFIADGQHLEKGVTGYVDYFTRDDSGVPQKTIEAALRGLNIPWYLNTISYENDTGYIHYEWMWGMYGDI
jgi:hypothetical protein